MRFLHTADWHVGKSLARRSRLDESEKALAELVAIAKDEKVDAVLVCGDIFEHLAPSPDAETIVYEALVSLERQHVPVVVIPGNHDAPRRWHALAPLLERFSVFVVPEVRRPDRGGVVEIASRDGSMTAQIAALPWVFERRLVEAAALMGLAEEPNQIYADEMARLIGALCTGLSPKKCTIFAGHLYVSGASLGGGERSLTIGQTYAVTPQALPSVQYAALGHVHRPQSVRGSAVPARYSGSLIQLDFGETEQDKSVVIVDLRPGKPAQVKQIPVTAGRRLLEVGGTMAELEAKQIAWGDAFLKVTLNCDAYRPGLGDEVRTMLPNAIDVRLAYPALEVDQGPTLRGLSPKDQFARYFVQRHDIAPSAELLALFDEVLDEAGS